jgi:hypothetical protein
MLLRRGVHALVRWLVGGTEARRAHLREGGRERGEKVLAGAAGRVSPREGGLEFSPGRSRWCGGCAKAVHDAMVPSPSRRGRGHTGAGDGGRGSAAEAHAVTQVAQGVPPPPPPSHGHLGTREREAHTFCSCARSTACSSASSEARSSSEVSSQFASACS